MAQDATAAEQRLRELLDQLSALDFCLPGSLSTRLMRCGQPRCRCKADPPQLHGPYTYWIRTVKGRSVARLLTPEQAERYRPWIESNHRLRQLVKEIEALSVQTAERAERWNPPRRTQPHPRRHT